jgi:hypothetical protein
VSEQWYRIALADRAGTRLVIAPGQHLGEAIALARRRAGRGDPGQVWPFAVEAAAPADVPLGESVGRGVVVERGPVPAATPLFHWPSGILPTLAGARLLGPPQVGYQASRQDDLHVVEAVTGGDRLLETFLGVVERLPAADNLEVRVTDHHDAAGTTEVWLSPRLGDVRKAIRFLDDHDVELLDNGHVEVAVYLRRQQATLRLTEHKTIVWLGEDPALAATFAAWLRDADVPPRDALARVASVDHHHWRPVASRDRKKLVQHLRRMRLRRVDSWT